MQIIPKHSFELVFSEYWQTVYTDIDRYLLANVNYYLINALEFKVAIEWKQQHIFCDFIFSNSMIQILKIAINVF